MTGAAEIRTQDVNGRVVVYARAVLLHDRAEPHLPWVELDLDPQIALAFADELTIAAERARRGTASPGADR